MKTKNVLETQLLSNRTLDAGLSSPTVPTENDDTHEVELWLDHLQPGLLPPGSTGGILAPRFDGKEKEADRNSFLPRNKKQHIQTSGGSTWKYGSASFQ